LRCANLAITWLRTVMFILQSRFMWRGCMAVRPLFLSHVRYAASDSPTAGIRNPISGTRSSRSESCGAAANSAVRSRPAL